MSTVFILFYGSFAGIALMFLLKVKSVGGDDFPTLPAENSDLATVSVSVARKLSIVKRIVAGRVALFFLGLAKNFLDWLFAVYKVGGRVLLRTKDRLAKAGRERKNQTSGNVSDYIKDVLDYKENLRNGNGGDEEFKS